MSDRKCPDCGERLSFDALRCACGWGAKKPDKGSKFFDMRCTYKAGSDRCNYPVGMFAEGNTSGWCVFHRQNPSQGVGAEIVMQSQRVDYAKAIQSLMDKAKNAPGVVDTAWEIAKRHGNKPWGEPSEYLAEAMRRRVA